MLEDRSATLGASWDSPIRLSSTKTACTEAARGPSSSPAQPAKAAAARVIVAHSCFVLHESSNAGLEAVAPRWDHRAEIEANPPDSGRKALPAEPSTLTRSALDGAHLATDLRGLRYRTHAPCARSLAAPKLRVALCSTRLS